MFRWIDDLIAALGSLWLAYFSWSILKINKEYHVQSPANIAFTISICIFCVMSLWLFGLSYRKFRHRNK